MAERNLPKPWVPKALEEPLRDFWRFYEAHYDELQRLALPALIDHPVFGPLLAQIPKEQMDAENVRSRELMRAAIEDGRWEAYEQNARAQGQLYAAMGVRFSDWFDLLTVLSKRLTPMMVSAFAAEPERLSNQLLAMHHFFDRAMALLAESYIESKEEALRRSEQDQAKVREIQLRNQKIEEANRLKSEFLANMSHELRTPLNSIIGFSELLHDGEVGSISAKQKEFLGYVVTSSRHLLQLINDILDLSKVEAGKLEFHPVPMAIESVVKEVLSILRTPVSAKRLKVTTEIAELGEVMLDPARFKQVLYNYLSNALKFTPEDGAVTVRARAHGPDGLRLEVEDTGIGISEADAQKLFTEFQQVDSTASKQHGGTGLGLALTRRLVEAQGGSVGVTSTPGKGSLFYAELPRRAGSKRAEPKPATSSGPTVLVIEDDPKDRQTIERILTGNGYSVELAGTGQEALDKCRGRSFAAVTLDLLLPDMSGFDALKAIRAQGRNADVPVVVLTVVVEDVTKGYPVHDVLPKPIDSASLLSSLKAAGVRPEASATVMVLDDDPLALELMAATLSQLGYRAECHQRGAAALDAVARTAPVAVVLDLLMPELDGFEFLARLRESPRGATVPVLVWTAMDLSTVDLEALKPRVSAIARKGGEASEVGRALKACLDARQLTAEAGHG
jgi:signal transduction histidine kinase/DNA-binding response OmpR family regulator